MSQVIKVIGPPGTGKTTYIKKQLATLHEQGVPFDTIGFFSFTRQALSAMAQKLKTPRLPPWFRTFHSFGAVVQGLDVSTILLPGDQSTLLGNAEGLITLKTQHKALYRDFQMRLNYAVNTGKTLTQHISELETTPFPKQDYLQLEKLQRAYQQRTGKLHFHDMLTLDFAEDLPRFKYLFIDEAQDLTNQQIKIVRRLMTHTETTWIVGDPNQSIYGWAGNSEDWLIKFPCDKQITLEKSYRMPRKIYNYSQKIASAMHSAYSFAPVGEGGSVQLIRGLNELPLLNGESWYILARTRYYLERGAQDYLDELAVPYFLLMNDTFEQEESIQAKIKGLVAYQLGLDMEVLSPEGARAIGQGLGHSAVEACRNKVPLISGSGLSIHNLRKLRAHMNKPSPHVALGTYHSSKGLEADNVVVLTDCTKKQAQEWEKDPITRSELCPFYVACTRAKKKLFILPGPKRNIRYGRFF